MAQQPSPHRTLQGPVTAPGEKGRTRFSKVDGQEHLEDAGGHLPHPRDGNANRVFRRDTVIVAPADCLQTQEHHRRKTVPVGRGIVEKVDRANDQRLMVGGRIEEATVLLIGELAVDGLTTAIIKFPGFADFQRSGTKNQNLFVCFYFHPALNLLIINIINLTYINSIHFNIILFILNLVRDSYIIF